MTCESRCLHLLRMELSYQCLIWFQLVCPCCRPGTGNHIQNVCSEDDAGGGGAPRHVELVQGRPVREDSVDGRADGASMADKAFEDEAEVESRFSAVEEVGDFDP